MFSIRARDATDHGTDQGAEKDELPADASQPVPLRRRMRSFLISAGIALLSVGVAAALWLPLLHFFYRPDISDYYSPSGALPSETRRLAAAQTALWSSADKRQDELDRMRQTNPEWDFMGRTFLVLSMANMALREPGKQYLVVADHIISDTLSLESATDRDFWLMDYARGRDFAVKDGRSLFIDGELTLMMQARRLVEEKAEYRPLIQARVTSMVLQMEQSPVLCAESYPSECWMFCNCVAAAAIRISDLMDGTDHSDFLDRWRRTVKEKLTDKRTGLLISSFDPDGSFLDGPEGSSIWMSAHCLAVVDPEFAEDQYRRARKELRRSILGFGYAMEWPLSWKSPGDVDSGPVIPILEISAGSSGLAFLGASTFGDTEYLRELISTLRFAAFPVSTKDGLRFAASNQVGDAVLLYSLVQGPLWAKVQQMSVGGAR